MTQRGGPLAGLRVVEFAGLAPVPFAAMMLADLGADVVCIERAVVHHGQLVKPASVVTTNVLNRNRSSVALDLKNPRGVELALSAVARADILLEGFRPGVMERLGLGPDVCRARNQRLIYGRLTGWGQTGPLARSAGHDINYIAVAGALHLVGRAGDRPVPPVNLVADFAGGGMLLAFGVLAALFERSRSGEGQTVDAAMVDGVALLTTMIHGLHADGDWCDERGANVVDGGAPYYDTYETADGGHVAVGAVEPQFYARMLSALGATLDPADQNDRARWPEARAELARRFKSKTRDEWAAIFESVDGCVSPVLSLRDVASHPYNTARDVFGSVGGVSQPAPAPRFDRTPTGVPTPPPPPSGHGRAPLSAWGVPDELLDAAANEGALLDAATPPATS